MGVYVFAGPTISKSKISTYPDFDVLPPVAMGDIYRVVAKKPKAIAIIDGYFDGVPSVWHKEILWALSKGVPVFGAASMGALRAAELHTFGMRGIGKIFEAYRQGVIEDDDEVALHHGPAEIDYAALSEPMVNIRATFEHALKQQIISQATASQLITLAKSQYYPMRNWENLVALGNESDIPDKELDAFVKWLPDNRVDQKYNDALAMLEALSIYLAGGSGRLDVKFNFEWTVMWNKVVESSDVGVAVAQEANDATSWIVDELRLDPGSFNQLQRLAFTRYVMEDVSKADKILNTVSIEPANLQQAITRFRTDQGLFMKADVDDWLAENDLDMPGLEKLVEGELRLAESIKCSGDAINEHILAELRLSGIYDQLALRAREKKQLLEKIGKANPDVDKATIGAMQLRIQFFESHFQQQIPSDLESFLGANGFPGLKEFDRMLAREYYFNRETTGSA